MISAWRLGVTCCALALATSGSSAQRVPTASAADVIDGVRACAAATDGETVHAEPLAGLKFVESRPPVIPAPLRDVRIFVSPPKRAFLLVGGQGSSALCAVVATLPEDRDLAEVVGALGQDFGSPLYHSDQHTDWAANGRSIVLTPNRTVGGGGVPIRIDVRPRSQEPK